MRNIHFYGEEVIIGTEKELECFVITYEQYKFINAINSGKTVKEYIDKLIGNNISDNDKSKLIEDLKKLYNDIGELLKKDDNKFFITGEKSKFYPRVMNVELTNRCNFNCKHCYKEAKASNFIFLSESILKNIRERYSGKIAIIQLTGGEPLLYNNIDKVIEYLSDTFCVNLTTNASLLSRLSDDIIKKIGNIQISLYGIDDNSYEEFTTNGQGFYSVIKAMNRITTLNKNFSLAITITKDLLDRPHEYVDFISAYKINRITFSTISYNGRGKNIELEISENDKLKLIEAFDKINITNNLKGVLDSDSMDYNIKDCNAGQHQITISENGRLIYCNALDHEIFDIGELNALESLSENGRNNIDFIKKIKKYCQSKKCVSDLCPLMESEYEKIHN